MRPRRRARDLRRRGDRRPSSTRASALAAAESGLPEAPAEDDPEYEQVAQQALANCAQDPLAAWRGRRAAGSRSPSATSTASTSSTSSSSSAARRGSSDFLKQSSIPEEELREYVDGQAFASRVGEELIGGPPDVPEELVEDFYEQNQEQFTQPASRDVREIVNEDEAEVEKAKAALESDDSDENWEKVAAEFSTAETKADGGLREGVVEGQDDPALEEEIFSAARGRARRPVRDRERLPPDPGRGGQPRAGRAARGCQRADRGADRPGPGGGASSNASTLAFGAKWRARTVCAEEFAIPQFCANAGPRPRLLPERRPGRARGCRPRPARPGMRGCGAAAARDPPRDQYRRHRRAAAGVPQGVIKPPADPAALPGGLPGLEGLPPGAAPPGAAPPPRAPRHRRAPHRPQGAVPPGG